MKPELIAFSQFKLGGIQTFYYNILSHAPKGEFDIRWIFENSNDSDSKLPQLYHLTEEIIFEEDLIPGETTYDKARRLEALISKREGAVLANFPLELTTLHLHRRPGKTIFFICHDEGYLPLAKKFEFLIDVFIAHNIQFHDEMVSMLPSRKNDIYFIPYGVKIPDTIRSENRDQPLRIVVASRLQEKKGVKLIPVIDDLLVKAGCKVNWTIIGNGPEKSLLQQMLTPRGNFKFHSPATSEEVLQLMKEQDVFLLPSFLDGLPVALLESMSVGCVPVISRFNSGISKVVTQDLGFVLPVEELNSFADAIIGLSKHRDELEKRSRLCIEKVRLDFDISKQSAKYFELFRNYRALKKPVRRKLVNYGGWLDHPAFPRPLGKLMRRVKNKILKS